MKKTFSIENNFSKKLFSTQPKGAKGKKSW